MNSAAVSSSQPAPTPPYLPSEGDAPPVRRGNDALQIPGGMVAGAATTGGAPEASGAALARAAPRMHLGCRVT